MVTRSKGLLTQAAIAASLLCTRQALAQEPAGGESTESPSEQGAPTTTEKVQTGTGAAVTGNAAEDAAKVKGGQEETSNVEHKGQTYYFVGARYRGMVVPQFMMNMFGADGGTTVYVHSMGPELGIRKDNFEYLMSLWWAGYYMKETPFKGKSDGDDAWEFIKSDINMIAFSTDFLWSHMSSPSFGINYGLTAGIGFPFGPLHRTEIYPGPGSSGDQSTWSKCQSAADPGAAAAGVGPYCEEGPKNEPNWANGGSYPIVFPYLGVLFGLRFKPHRNFAAHLDLGFWTTGLFFGLGLDYGV